MDDDDFESFDPFADLGDDVEPDYSAGAACFCDETARAEAGYRARKGDAAGDEALRETLQTRVAEERDDQRCEVARGLLERGASAEEIRAYFATDATAWCLLFVLEDALGGTTGS